jgi:antitoxin HicB
MTNYYAKITKEDGYYIVSFPEFPNVNTYGETLEEALTNASEALNGAIESDFERGFEFPKPKKYTGRNYHKIDILPHIQLAQTLRTLRKDRPQKEIARQLNVTPQAYQKLENPRKCNPTIKTLEKISQTFGKKLSIKIG